MEATILYVPRKLRGVGDVVSPSSTAQTVAATATTESGATANSGSMLTSITNWLQETQTIGGTNIPGWVLVGAAAAILWTMRKH